MTVSSDTWNFYCVVDGSTTIGDGQWHHISAVVFRRASCTTNDILIYVDGVQETTSVAASGANTNVDISNNDPLTIGAYYNLGSREHIWDGKIDDVRIYNYALTPTQIRTLYNENSAIRFGPLTGSP